MKYTCIITISSIILSILSAYEIKPKLCIDCKFFRISDFSKNTKFGKCLLFPQTNDDDFVLVNGHRNNHQEYYYCSTSRKYDNMCGKEGKYYEENEKEI